jgi:hypothetical protein
MNRVAALGGHSDPLQIRKPAPPVLIVSMADIIAGDRPFAADFTFFCHDKTPSILDYDHNGLCENGLYTCSGKRRQAFSKVRLWPCVDRIG